MYKVTRINSDGLRLVNDKKEEENYPYLGYNIPNKDGNYEHFWIHEDKYGYLAQNMIFQYGIVIYVGESNSVLTVENAYLADALELLPLRYNAHNEI